MVASLGGLGCKADREKEDELMRLLLGVAGGVLIGAAAAVAVVKHDAVATSLRSLFHKTTQADMMIDICERTFKTTLKAPSSYKRISASVRPSGNSALITYDAMNSFGAMLRGDASCDFEEGSHGVPHLTSVRVDGTPMDKQLVDLVGGVAEVDWTLRLVQDGIKRLGAGPAPQERSRD